MASVESQKVLHVPSRVENLWLRAKGCGVELGVRTLSTVARVGFTVHRLEGNVLGSCLEKRALNGEGRWCKGPGVCSVWLLQEQ